MALDPKTLAEMDAALNGAPSVDIAAMDAVLGQPTQTRAPQSLADKVAGFAGNLNPLGSFADEAAAALGAVPVAAIGAFSPEYQAAYNPEGKRGVGNALSTAYNQLLQGARQTTGQFAQDNPVTALGANVAGGVAGAVGAARGLPSVTKGISDFAKRGFGQKVATAAGLGAVSGGVYGFGAGEGGFENRAEEAMAAAPYGAGFGVAIPMAAVVARPLTERVKNLLARRAAAIPAGATMQDIAQAADMPAPAELSEKMVAQVGKKLQGEFGAALPTVTQALKDEGTAIIDTHSAKVRQLAKGAAQYAGGQEVAEKFFNERLSKVPDDIVRTISKNIASADAFYATTDDLLEAGRGKARPLYESAYKAVVPDNVVTKQLYQMPEISGALDAAYKKFPSELQGVGRNSIKALDYAKRVLDDEISTAQRAGEGNLARSRIGIKNQLLEAMDAASPAYKEARKVSGDYLSIDRAMNEGREFMKIDPEKLGMKFKGMPETEKNAFKVGVAKQLRDLADKTLEGGNAYNRIFGRPDNQKRLAAVLSPEQYKNFAEDMRATDRLFSLRNEILGQSPTASKQVAAKEIAELGGFMTANPQMGVMQAVQSYIRKSFDGLNDRTARQVAEIIFEERPAQKLKIIDEITKGKGLSMTEKRAAKQAFVMVDTAFNEIKAAQMGAAGVLGAKTQQEDK